MHELAEINYGSGVVCKKRDLEGWRFFRSPLGFMGLAPTKAQPIDSIFLLFGAHIPYLLSKNEDKPTYL